MDAISGMDGLDWMDGMEHLVGRSIEHFISMIGTVIIVALLKLYEQWACEHVKMEQKCFVVDFVCAFINSYIDTQQSPYQVSSVSKCW